MFQGNSVKTFPLDDGFVEIRFDREGDWINKLDARTVDQFRRAVQAVAAVPGLRGVLVTSGKDVFIVGADITEFGATFRQTAPAIAEQVLRDNQVFVAFEDLPVPTVVSINGYALGGGLELALAGSVRIMSTVAQVGVPEVKLGLFPGFGGTVRLSRIAGPAVAVAWVASGEPADAAAALAAGVVDEIAAPPSLREAAIALLMKCADGAVDWQARRQRKLVGVALSDDQTSLFAAACETARRAAGKHQPAIGVAVDLMREAAGCSRTLALQLEAQAFARVAKTQAAASLVQKFLNEQAVRKIQKKAAGQARKPQSAGVLGAGIMGGGIAQVAAMAGTRVRLKDIDVKQLDLGLAEAARLLDHQVKRGRLSRDKADLVLASIEPQLDDTGFDQVEFVVEAIVEKLEVKQRVLAQLESVIAPTAFVASNTSSLRIDQVGALLTRKENLVGMHFFNPVPAMPLVEIVRGGETSDEAVAAAVAWALAMRKTPIVVRDCPGFLVNRLLTPYIQGFLQLVAAGVDFERIDRVMEAYGWPMGPAYLEDVVGMDTGAHVSDVISAGYPDRMVAQSRDAMKLLVQNGRLGQKSGSGFYAYERDATGRLKKRSDPAAHAILAQGQAGIAAAVPDAEIVDRMMLPLLTEAVRAIADSTAGSAAELDMAMLLGVGFPAYLGGPLKLIDWLGAAEVIARCERHAHLGAVYTPPPLLREMALSGGLFHPL